ncbi:MAG: glycosyltransferase [Coriobacteriia bacterium]|nr:glycosyltransferase [Coriobacteriia bacterium]MBN2847952.1 glycosyltransferase [Coriobacteriia bacterium]
MRIAIFTDTYLPEVNGVVTSIDSHTRLLGARGHQVLIICPKYRKPILHVVPHVQIKRYRSFSVSSNRATRLALPSMASVAATLRRFDPDVVHVHTPLSVGVVGLATARMMRLPIVETYHTYIPDFMQYLEPHRLLRLDSLQDRIVDSMVYERMFSSGMFHGLADLIRDGRGAVDEVAAVAEDVKADLPPDERMEVSARFAWQFTRTVYNRANVVITPSVTLQKELRAHGVTVPVEYLSNGIDTSIVTPKDTYAPTKQLLHAGRLGHEKNVDQVLQAFALLLEREPDYTLDIVGDGPAREHLERVAARLGIGAKVKMRGFVDRAALGRIYRSYDAFVTASTIETQGIVLLEAMSAGLPIVAVRALAVPEIVGEGRAGLLVEPGDIPGLADALVRVVGDQALREEMGAAGREDVHEHALSEIVVRLEELYGVAVASRAG